MAARGDDVVALFRSHDAKDALLFTRTSLDGGTTWGPRVRIDRVATSLRWAFRSVTITDAGILVAWTVRSTGRIYTSLSTDGGTTFSAVTDRDDELRLRLRQPRLSGRAREPRVGRQIGQRAWSDERNSTCGADELFLRRSTDGGLTWKTPLVPTGAKGTLGWPEVAVHGKTVLLLLSPQRSGQLLLRSSNGGRSFQRPKFSIPLPTTAQATLRSLPRARRSWSCRRSPFPISVTSPQQARCPFERRPGRHVVAPRLVQAMSAAIISPNVVFSW